jgi:hypothetical protein
MRQPLQNVLLVVAATIVGLLGVETLARFTGVAGQFGRMISSKQAPHRMVDGVVLWGVRNPRYDEEDLRRVSRATEAFLVLGLGDSILFGVDLAKEDTYLEIARRVLAQRTSRPVEMLNMAVPGYSTMQESAVYKEVEDRIRPDLVLVHYWGDDAAQFRVLGRHVVDFGDLSDDGRTVIRPFPIPPRASDFLLEHSRLYATMVGFTLNRSRRSRPRSRELERVAKPLAEIHERARRAGARMIIVVSPQLTGATASPIDDLEFLRNFGAPRGIEVIDLSEWLQGIDVQRIAMDGCHFNVEGHRLLGARFAEYLLQRNLKGND